MEQSEFTKYREERYNKQLEYYKSASAKNQRRYRQFQWMLIILSAMTPVLAALSDMKFSMGDNVYSLHLKIPVVIVSAVVAILTTGLKTFNYQELWVTYRSTYEKLKPEIHYYQFNVGPYNASGIDKESLFVTRIESILDSEHTLWPASQKLNEGKDGEDESKNALAVHSASNAEVQ